MLGTSCGDGLTQMSHGLHTFYSNQGLRINEWDSTHPMEEKKKKKTRTASMSTLKRGMLGFNNFKIFKYESNACKV